MHFEHDLQSSFAIHLKKPLQYLDYEIHGRVIVIEQNHLVHARRLGFCAFRCEYCAAVVFGRHNCLGCILTLILFAYLMINDAFSSPIEKYFINHLTISTKLE
jgi:hypothetical protein